VSAEKYIAKNNPVMIWVIKQSPLRDPKVHKVEMFLGAAKDIKGLRFIEFAN
jgi:hypothetical protein